MSRQTNGAKEAMKLTRKQRVHQNPETPFEQYCLTVNSKSIHTSYKLMFDRASGTVSYYLLPYWPDDEPIDRRLVITYEW